MEPFIHTCLCVSLKHTLTQTHTLVKKIKMKCEGFGSVQALWLGRLRYKER